MNKVYTVERKEIRTVGVDPSSYVFRKDKKHHWLQRLCFRVLDKLEAYKKVEHITFSTHRIDTDYFVDRVMRQQRDIFNYYHPDRPVELIIGAEDYNKLAGTPEFNQLVEFEVPLHFNGRGRHRLMGLRVTIVPWMQGILVIPERK
jgi:hypothetical protein